MIWIGLKSEELVRVAGGENSWLSMSIRDRNTAMSMLNSKEWKDEEGNLLPGLRDCYTELQRMLWLNRKAEMQMLDEVEGGLSGWLTGKISACLANVQA